MSIISTKIQAKQILGAFCEFVRFDRPNPDECRCGEPATIFLAGSRNFRLAVLRFFVIFTSELNFFGSRDIANYLSVLKDAQELSEAERLLLIETLWETVPEHSALPLHEAWGPEIERRVAALDAETAKNRSPTIERKSADRFYFRSLVRSSR